MDRRPTNRTKVTLAQGLSWTEQVRRVFREAIDDERATIRGIATAAEIEPRSAHRFLDGADMNSENVYRLAKALGFSARLYRSSHIAPMPRRGGPMKKTVR